MRVLLVSSSDFGGAGLACLRLLRALLLGGIDARMLVQNKSSSEPGVYEWAETYDGIGRKARKLLRLLTQYITTRKNESIAKGRSPDWEAFTPPLPAALAISHPFLKWADVVHLHWSAQFWNWGNFAKVADKKILWTLHDLNPCTGGCHYPGECQQFYGGCLHCPQLEGARHPKIVKKYFSYRAKALSKLEKPGLTVISPSSWISNEAKKSALFKDAAHRVVPNAFDETVFRPLDQVFCRDALSIPRGKRILMFAANYLGNHRKGMDILLDALRLLAENDDIVVYAAGHADLKAHSHVTVLGNVSDERLMAVAYNAADAFVMPSREDNLPNTVAESLLCGTPVVGFKRGGVPEMIEDGTNGIIVDDLSAPSLADGIRRGLGMEWNKEFIASAARNQFSRKKIADMHIELYRSLRAKTWHG
jgi:glycosyltransferase involved in cell wall biosynthesis